MNSILDTMCRCFNESTCGDIGQCADTDTHMSEVSNHGQQAIQRISSRQGSLGGSNEEMTGAGGSSGGMGGGVIGAALGGMKIPIRGNNNWDAIFQTGSSGSGGGSRKKARSSPSGAAASDPPLLKGSSDLSKSDGEGVSEGVAAALAEAEGSAAAGRPATPTQQPRARTSSAPAVTTATMANASSPHATPTPKSSAIPMCGFDIENAEAALAQARQEANAHARAAMSRRSRSSSSHRSRSAKRKADIFRSRPKPMTSAAANGSAHTNNNDDVDAAQQQQPQTESAGANEDGRMGSPVPTGGFCSASLNNIAEEEIDGTNHTTSSFTRLMPILCFANPIRDSASDTEDAQNSLTGNSPVHDDDMTHDTYGEETITSTLYFDNKFGQIVESRPPMPLYRNFQVVCTEKKTDELTKIVKNESHRSFARSVVTVEHSRALHSRRNQQPPSPSRDNTPIARNRVAVGAKPSPDRSEASSVPPPPPPVMAAQQQQQQHQAAVPFRHRMLVENFEVQNLSDTGHSSSSESESSASSAPEDKKLNPWAIATSEEAPVTPTTPTSDDQQALTVPVQVTPGTDESRGSSRESRGLRGSRHKRRGGRGSSSSSGRGPAVPELLQTPETSPGSDPSPTAITPERTTPTSDTEPSSIQVKA